MRNILYQNRKFFQYLPEIILLYRQEALKAGRAGLFRKALEKRVFTKFYQTKTFYRLDGV